MKLRRLAKSTLADTIHRPKLSTVQAGLLLLQHTEDDASELTLRDWFSSLPPCLNMDSTNILKLSSVGKDLRLDSMPLADSLIVSGYLRLVYLSTEITPHRRIVQALTSNTPPALYQICRSAARERFLSAVQFMKSLRPQHLQPFWYFASAQHFALIGTFECLLYATARGPEADFHQSKLREYR